MEWVQSHWLSLLLAVLVVVLWGGVKAYKLGGFDKIKSWLSGATGSKDATQGIKDDLDSLIAILGRAKERAKLAAQSDALSIATAARLGEAVTATVKELTA